MTKIRVYVSQLSKTTHIINRWDILALVVVLGILVAFAWGASQMAAPYQLGQEIVISLSPSKLPEYALRSVFRIMLALIFSLLFSFIFGTWAAKSVRAERILIPLIDILQSVPVLSFLSIFFVAFIALFPNNLLGPECASIFAIFTAQVWNITLGFYQSLRLVPYELKEASRMFHLNAWQQFWRVEVPFSLPTLLWNTMMSLSASWFFVVASEAISVSNQDIRLPGIGSYIALAIQQASMHAILYAIIAMLIVILCYDQLFFRPLVHWSEQFSQDNIEESEQQASDSWVLNILRRTRLMRYISDGLSRLFERFVNVRLFSSPAAHVDSPLNSKHVSASLIGYFFALALIAVSLILLFRFIILAISPQEMLHVFLLGLITATRVFVLIIAASLLWIPIGVRIGMNARLARIAQPIAQFLAAFPANVLFPVVVIAIIHFKLNVEIWLTPLMILGSQWYILFNVIAAASHMPKELRMVAKNFGLSGWLWWKRLALPWIFPYYITGAITAAGGAWNASIVAEIVSWGDTTLQATGLGSYIAHSTDLGDFPRIALGTSVMCIFVLIFNRLVWRPLYQFAERRFQ